MKNRLINGECLEEMDKLIQEGVVVDAIICDIPFATSPCKWDTLIPFEAMWERLNKLIKPKGAIALFGIEPFSSALRMSNIKNYKYDWIWKKPKGTGFLNAKKRPLKDTENIMIFNAHHSVYNPVFSKGKPYKAKQSSKQKEIKAGENNVYKSFKVGGDVKTDNTGFRYPKTIIEFGVVERNTVHPTQKPVDLMEYLIKTYTNKGELVLDFTAGSFTTGVACQNTDRNFIGIEKNKDFFEVGKQRMKNNQ
jgi:site-specific DNA-methyltransferase (adenine-specific)